MHRWRTPVVLRWINSLLMMVYAPDRREIFLASTSFCGRTPSTKKSLIGCTQEGVVTTTKTDAITGACTAASSDSDPDASAIGASVLELTTAALGCSRQPLVLLARRRLRRLVLSIYLSGRTSS